MATGKYSEKGVPFHHSSTPSLHEHDAEKSEDIERQLSHGHDSEMSKNGTHGKNSACQITYPDENQWNQQRRISHRMRWLPRKAFLIECYGSH
ncbi:hypothetical protein BT63DRAFT_184145 [Microthyrium microscopicum]|uniref:Uncharacterized protein n=1 Tax=Microthyrium microscopicum TaxID=703497 RepID=A0A6A6UJI6_9PEZI|nr:hypothetical protein BT63DRAFT_184145 [Microthyrium microscopicum]